jgi:tetracycline repressor-like protein
MGRRERERRRPAPVLSSEHHRAKAKLGDKLVQIACASGDIVGLCPRFRVSESAEVHGDDRYRNKAELAAAVIGSLRVEEPPSGAPSPRAHALAILENFHSNLRTVPALAILGSLLAEEERHPELLHLFKTRLVEPRRALLRQALAASDFPDSADLDVLTSMLIGSFYGRYVTTAGIPDDWPDRVLSAIWPPDTSPR